MAIVGREIKDFQTAVWKYYDNNRRDLPWRTPHLTPYPDGSLDPYAIMVSELMLQQTQVPRVIPKYQEFMSLFPTVHALAAANQGDVLRAWSGLGYNRRARFLWLAAQEIVARFDGKLLHNIKDLSSLPGIGKNTAGAIMTYAFNEPVVFVETNLRTVFIHHFFKDEIDVPDSYLLPLIEAALPGSDRTAREWYWALMDYGSYLKSEVGNVGRASKHYVRQSTFQGSKRQVRGMVLRLLADGPLSREILSEQVSDERLTGILDGLVAERLIRYEHGYYTL
jgi:A/G-specific adenine glycosylase